MSGSTFMSKSGLILVSVDTSQRVVRGSVRHRPPAPNGMVDQDCRLALGLGLGLGV